MLVDESGEDIAITFEDLDEALVSRPAFLSIKRKSI